MRATQPQTFNAPFIIGEVDVSPEDFHILEGIPVCFSLYSARNILVDATFNVVFTTKSKEKYSKYKYWMGITFGLFPRLCRIECPVIWCKGTLEVRENIILKTMEELTRKVLERGTLRDAS